MAIRWPNPALAKPDDLPWCAAFWSELTFACIGQLIAFATAQLGPAPSGYSVVSTGSTARHELLGGQETELAILCEESGSAYFSHLTQICNPASNPAVADRTVFP